mgnify:CR=1 FL=1|jgi:hypothetical protein
MTYKELVDSIGATVNRHYILQDFGYGALTDIKTVDEGTRVNYPYAFLNPTQSTRTGQTVTYRFNLIVMDVAQEDPTNGFADYLKVQSDCQQYIDDILANLRFSKPYQDFDLTLNVNLTPFKERFQDTVAGMTATLEMELPLALNDCITPIAENVVMIGGFAPGAYAEPDPVGQVISQIPPTYDPQGLFQTCFYTGAFLEGGKTFEIIASGTARALEAKPITQPPSVNLAGINMTPCTFANDVTFIREYAADSTGWPENQVTTAEFKWEATYRFTTQPTGADQRINVGYALYSNDNTRDESQMEFINTEIKIYEL